MARIISTPSVDASIWPAISDLETSLILRQGFYLRITSIQAELGRSSGVFISKNGHVVICLRR
jgi:hypothetical protein